ncbi:CHAT domain-containing tetratricopeptide repeat protein [Fuerstiella marisgermanici]|uniref:CHAT domain-containing tetratricopeptide repeat protein n=1 Tax=Fuerstiella marisgermanici TaxID=1891926 RepID=UPI001314D1B2|nr:tetratricopeptide repeat protein [Fuerstiella marisgermanici]
MATSDLVFNFSSPEQVTVSYDGTGSGRFEFVNPVTEKDRQDIRWYVETYGAHSLAEPDDNEARRIEARLPEIGRELFKAVFNVNANEFPEGSPALKRYNAFQQGESGDRVITIESEDASILSIPWELIHDSKQFLFTKKPHISIRRKISGATEGETPFKVEPKQQLHLLFVVSRPTDAGFIDPRADPKAVLDAVEEFAPGRVTFEFLRPATLNTLIARLDDDTKPVIDILHFDGHGVFKQVSEEDVEKQPGMFGRSVQSAILRERATRDDGQPGKPVGIGFLVFEKDDGKKQLISADDLGEKLHKSRVALVVLSACQTASLDEEGDPMASVAGRLTSTGTPAILAMTHSVLVTTTKTLFGKFYESLARERSIGRSLDDARVFLADNPEKFEVRRGDKREMLTLNDWFVPTLFRSGPSSAMLTESDGPPTERPVARHNLRKSGQTGFFGRRRELWDIECWFADKARRISITGFGGQGKTELALEAGRWLLRTGMFHQAVFIDFASVQSADPVSVAVSTISATVEETLIDADAVTQTLQDTPTLVILDNLETLAEEPLQDLLTAASAWSQAGQSRVLLTSRRPETGHPDFAVQGTHDHQRIVLKGLGAANAPDDALDWFAELDRLPSTQQRQVPPPKRDDLIRLFDRVRFHPLSICVLVQQLKSRTAGQLETRLEQLLSEDSTSLVAEEGTPDSLVASLQLSLERLSDEERHAVRRLGVFQGGAMEDDLLAITELGESNRQREQLQSLLSALEGGDPSVLLKMMGKDLPDDAEVPPELLQQLTNDPEWQQHIQQLRDQLAALPESAADNIWPGLRQNLEAAALIEAESILGVGPPFLRFHPTLAPMLWGSLSAEERESLAVAHRQRYYALANYLYKQDSKNPHQARAIVRRELPNLLHAVHGALDASDADAVDFVDSVNGFLNNFGMTREAALLTQRAEQAGGERGSESWFLAQSNRGEQLLSSGQVGDAAQIFTDILESLGENPSYNRATTLARLGGCYKHGGRPDLAEATHRKGIAVTEQLEETDQVKRHRGVLHTELADVLADQGKYGEAREHYELGLKPAKELNDLRQQTVTLGQLGMLAMLEGDLADAVKRYREALELFQRLGEPAMEAVAQHQLGMAFQESKQWEQAEHHYRESARLKEAQGMFGGQNGVETTWNQLAVVAESSGKPEAAEIWYRKAIDGGRKTGDTASVAKMLNNLAVLLQSQPGRLDEARELAEEALAIKQTLDPGAAAIWKIYEILAQIADQQNRPDEAVEYRRQAREAKRNFAGNAHEMKRHLPVIVGVLRAIEQPETGDDFRAAIAKMEEHGWGNLVGAINEILAGERNAGALCAALDFEDSMIIETILAAIDDPTTLSDLLPKDNETNDGGESE